MLSLTGAALGSCICGGKLTSWLRINALILDLINTVFIMFVVLNYSENQKIYEIFRATRIDERV